MTAWATVGLAMFFAAGGCAANPGASDWACETPQHGDYFMDELHDTPQDAVASVVDDPSAFTTSGDGSSREYVDRNDDGAVERLVEIQQDEGARWGVVAVTSCDGFG